jgi:hypothetical protein
MEVTASVVPSSPILVTLMKEALSSSETSVLTRATRSNILEDTILYQHKLALPRVSKENAFESEVKLLTGGNFQRPYFLFTLDSSWFYFSLCLSRHVTAGLKNNDKKVRLSP